MSDLSIDLSQYEFGQRFRTRGGFVFALEAYHDGSGNFVLESDTTGIAYSFRHNGRCIGVPELDLISPICRVPANTRRIPSIKLDPVLEKAV